MREAAQGVDHAGKPEHPGHASLSSLVCAHKLRLNSKSSAEVPVPSTVNAAKIDDAMKIKEEEIVKILKKEKDRAKEQERAPTPPTPPIPPPDAGEAAEEAAAAKALLKELETEEERLKPELAELHAAATASLRAERADRETQTGSRGTLGIMTDKSRTGNTRTGNRSRRVQMVVPTVQERTPSTGVGAG